AAPLMGPERRASRSSTPHREPCFTIEATPGTELRWPSAATAGRGAARLFEAHTTTSGWNRDALSTMSRVVGAHEDGVAETEAVFVRSIARSRYRTRGWTARAGAGHTRHSPARLRARSCGRRSSFCFNDRPVSKQNPSSEAAHGTHLPAEEIAASASEMHVSI